MLRRSQEQRVQCTDIRNPSLIARHFRQAKSDFDFDHLLPFSLQDLSLLEVINDLDSYPVELLASMPLWFRKKFLSNLPILDLVRLEQTKVAKDVNVDSIWIGRFYSLLASRQPSAGVSTAVRYSQLSLASFHLTCKPSTFGYPNKSRIAQALESIKKYATRNTWKAECLFEITASILSNMTTFDNDQNDKSVLISIDREQLYKNLLLQPTRSRMQQEKIYTLLRKQRTMLTLIELGKENERQPVQSRVPNALKKNNVVWIPHRFMHHYLRNDATSTVLSLLANECCVRPPSVNICIDELSHEILAHLKAERYAQVNGLVASPLLRVECCPSVHQILSMVKILRFSSISYSTVDAIIGMIETLKANRNKCQLQHLFCESRDLFPDLVKALTGLFHLPNFSELSLNFTSLRQVNFMKLIQGFVTSPCSHTQTLTLVCSNILPYFIEREDLATIDINLSDVPHCAVKHKIVRFIEREGGVSLMEIARLTCNIDILAFLLQFSIVRLNEIYIGSSKGLHLCTLHPDLQVMKIEMDLENTLVETIREDLTNILFKIPYLQEITISGTFGNSTRAKSGLVQGLTLRARAHTPLKKIVLMDISQDYSDIDYQELWDAIFSLPEIDSLEVILSKLMLDASNQSESECMMMFKSWSKSGKECRLKYVSIVGLGIISETDRRHLPFFTQKYSFVAPYKMC